MLASLEKKLFSLVERHQELGLLLGETEVLSNADRFRELSKEYAQLDDIIASYTRYKDARRSLDEARPLLNDADPSMRDLAQSEIDSNQSLMTALEKDLEILLLPKDPNDERNIFLEVRAGTGGDEAAIFAGDLFRMYARYAESKRWQVEIISESFGEHGGYKEIVARILGQNVYSNFKFESGTHRVQRVPNTEAQGRIHTSACTVAILPEVDAIETVDINPADLKVDTYRASGAGGQHVNKTDSAIRITHLPTGIIVECQDERSQHKNRSRAMSLLKAKMLAAEQEKQTSKQAESRRLQVGSGDRSERIRTYNYPQGRITDHRINLTVYKLNQVLDGNVDELVIPLQEYDHSERLAEMSREAEF